VIQTRTIAKNGITFDVVDRPEYRSFWDSYESDAWEPETIAVFTRFLRPDARYVDLGAWIGPTVFLAAALVSRVVCVEPDPLAYAALTDNLELNPDTAAKTLAVQAAAGPTDGAVVLTSAGEGGDSNSSVARPGDSGARWEITQMSFPTLLTRTGLAGADFVKVDIEAAEYELVPAIHWPLLGTLPTLYVALHPNLLLDKRSLTARLWSSMHALRANRRFLRALLPYRHHYVYDVATRQFRDIRMRNRARVLLPLPIRSSFLVGACVFTNEEL
jgi:FkbM family methyltransferase